ncbi:hypothetical protein ACOSQ2_001035 [Xanthoceras sorbifolium]
MNMNLKKSAILYPRVYSPCTLYLSLSLTRRKTNQNWGRGWEIHGHDINITSCSGLCIIYLVFLASCSCLGPASSLFSYIGVMNLKNKYNSYVFFKVHYFELKYVNVSWHQKQGFKFIFFGS